jgi:hypothetical protein
MAKGMDEEGLAVCGRCRNVEEYTIAKKDCKGCSASQWVYLGDFYRPHDREGNIITACNKLGITREELQALVEGE